jgi:hypothetical protein
MAWKLLLAGVEVLVHAGARQRHVVVVKARLISSSEDHMWFEDRWMVASLCDE